MFTGLIEEQGLITDLKKADGSLRLNISCNSILDDIYVDASIALNGCCLTVTSFTKNTFSVLAIEETLRKTNLSNLTVGEKVNLERAIKHSDRLGGHLVQGHVDGTIKLLDIKPEDTGTALFFELPEDAGMLIVDKGSICIDGISLTVADLGKDYFKLAIIPHTWEKTNVSKMQIGYLANLEYDLTGKYIQKMIQPYINKLK